MRNCYWFFRLCVIATVIVTASAGRVAAETPDRILDIWPGPPPGGAVELGPERDVTKDTDKLIAGRRIIKLGNVSQPQAHVFLPPANLRTGASVVICPGGGFSILAWDLEGTEVAQWLNTVGITGVVLKYRVPTRDRDPRWVAPAQDAQRTISLVRHHAREWGLDPEKIGILGFSAGGMTAFKTAVSPERFYPAMDEVDQSSCRPNRAILIYAAGLPDDASPTDSGQDDIGADMPPTFLAHAFDDFVPVAGTANLLLALKRAGVPSELHIYDAGGHGYGLRRQLDFPVTTWTDPCTAWLRRAGWIDKQAQ